MDRPLSSHNGLRRASWPCSARVRRASAFTLLEVLTVIALVGLLVAIAFTATGGAMERAHRARCRSDLAVLAQALEAYPGLSVVFSGGVASNSMLRELTATLHPVFAQPQFSTDNAMGVAVLTKRLTEE